MHATTAPTTAPVPGAAPGLWITTRTGTARCHAPQTPVTVGQHPGCTVTTMAKAVAPQHLDLRWTPQGWVATDLGTSTGTWIGGTAITATLVTGQLWLSLGHPDSPDSLPIRLDVQPAQPTRTVISGGRLVVRLVAVVVAMLAVLATVGATINTLEPAGADVHASPSGPTNGEPTDRPEEQDRPTGEAEDLPDDEEPVDEDPPAPSEPEDAPPATGPEALPNAVPASYPTAVTTFEGLYVGDDSAAGLTALLDAQLADVHAFWANALEGQGISLPKPDHAWIHPAGELAHPCGDPENEAVRVEYLAHYCGSTDHIEISLQSAHGDWHGTVSSNHLEHAHLPSGDLSVALLVAHEYAHYVQDRFQIWKSVPGYDGYTFRSHELHADCLAGVWGTAAWRAGLISDADEEEIVATLFRIGTQDSTEHTHGDPQERHNAFVLGYTSGSPSDCNTLLRR